MKNRLRVPAILLALLMCLNLLPFAAFADDFSGADDPVYNVILSPGTGSGEEQEFSVYDPASVTADREHAGNCQFFTEDGMVFFKLSGCPFSAPSGHVFSGWSPDPDNTAVTQETRFTAQWKLEPEAPVLAESKAVYALTVNNGSAGGNFEAGATVTVTANDPADGQRFKSWEGTEGLSFAEGSSATTASITFTMPAAAVTLTATYEASPAETYILTVNNGSAGGNFAAGATVTVTANDPADGQRFKSWEGTEGLSFAEGSSATTASITFTMPAAAVTLTATYEASPAETYTLTVNNGATGGSFAAGTTVTVTANDPADGQRFKSWEGADGLSFAEGSSATTASITFTMPDHDVTVTATYESITYTVTVSNDGNGTGSANPASGTKGTPVTITAEPKEDYRFKEWKVISGGVTLAGATTATTTFTIGTDNVEVKAIFEEISYVVTVNAAAHGTVTADPVSAPKGATVTLTITPESGYELDTIDVKDPAGQTVSVSNNTFVMPKCNVTVSATFKAAVPVSYKITTGANGAWIKGSGLTYSLTAKRSVSDNETVSHFTGVMIDKNIVPITDYTIKAGSVIVTLKAATMQKLALGYHTITLYFDDGTAATRVYIWGNPGYPSTGDERDTAAWAVLAGVTLIGMGAIAILGCMYWKKQKNK